MCRINASLAAGTGRYLWNPSLLDGGSPSCRGGWRGGICCSPTSRSSAETQLPGEWPLASKPPVTATAASCSPWPRCEQLCFIFASVNRYSSGFMLVS